MLKGILFIFVGWLLGILSLIAYVGWEFFAAFERFQFK